MGDSGLIHRSELMDALAEGQGTIVALGIDDGEIHPDEVPTNGLVVSVEPVIEAVKRVEVDVVVAGVDRNSLVHIGQPMFIHRSTLVLIVAEEDSEYLDLPTAVFNRGGQVVARTDSPA